MNGTNLGFWALREFYGTPVKPRYLIRTLLACTTPLDATIAFGGKAWPISGDDLKLRSNIPGTCFAGIYESDTVDGVTPSLSSPNWIIGAAFLVRFPLAHCTVCLTTLMLSTRRQKNVYSVYRATPPSVGFARLSRLAGGTGQRFWISTVHSSHKM